MGKGAAFAGTERFEIRRRLGEGGMGVVYEAFDRDQGTLVALKSMRSVTARSLLRFKNEFRALQDIEHPNLVRLGELIEDKGSWFFTMELVEGSNFIAYVRDESTSEDAEADQDMLDATPSADTFRLPVVPVGAQPSAANNFHEARLRSALGQLGLGLQALHTAGMVHRDVKPSNVLVTPEGRVVLLDFGLLLDESSPIQSSHHDTVGTAAYMAPEQASASRPGPPADWYAFGVMLYEALTGQLPFVGPSLQVLMDKQQRTPPPPHARCSEVPPDLDELCANLLRFDPSARPSGPDVLRHLGVGVDVAPHPHTTSRFLQEIPFVGRTEELTELETAFEQSAVRGPILLFVDGESGVGKSELVRTFCKQIKESRPHTVVLNGRCYERESVPYKAFDGIADALSQHLCMRPDVEVAQMMPPRAKLLGDLFPVMQRVEAVASAPLESMEHLDVQEQRKRMFRVLRELLATIGERQPLVLVIDDFQWADPDSLVLLDELIHPTTAPHMLVVATARTGPDGERCAAIATASSSARDVRHVELGQLPREPARRLVCLLAPELVARNPDAVETIVEDARGHPLFIHELALWMDADPANRTATRLDTVLWSRVSRLATPARELLELLCVSDAPISRRVAALATRQERDVVERAVSTLRVGFLARSVGVRETDTVEPYHNRVRETVVAHLDPEVRRRYHARLAIGLERVGAAETEPQILVGHLEAAGDTARAATLAEAAAARAARALAFDQAAELYQTAIRLGDHKPSRVQELRLLLGAALVNSGRGREAADAFLEAAERAEGTTRRDCQRQAAEQLLASGHIKEGLDALASLLEEIGVRLPATPRRALVSLLGHRVRLRIRGLRWTRRHESEVVPLDLTRIEAYNMVAHSLGIVDTIRGADFQARGLLLSLRTGEEFRVGRALTTEATYLASQGATRRARTLLDRARRIADRTRHPYLTAFATTMDGAISYFEGHFTSAARALLEAEQAFRAIPGATVELNFTKTFRLLTCRLSGTIAEQIALYDRYLRDAMRRGDRYAETTIRRCCNIVWLSADDVDGARENLMRAAWMPPEGVFHLQHWYELEADIEHAIYSGELGGIDFTPRFRAITRSLLLRVQTVRATLHWVRARLALARAERTTAREALVHEAAKMARKLHKERLGYARVWSGLVSGGVAIQREQRGLAIEILHRAVREAEANDMPLAVAVARRRLGELTGGEDGAAWVEQSESWMSEQGVKSPERLCALLGPGYAHTAPKQLPGG